MHSGSTLKAKPLSDEQKKLVEDNIKLAHIFAKRWPFPMLSREDNLSESFFCLCRAAHGFRPELGFTFSTFAATYHKNWIREGWRIYGAKHKGAGVAHTRYNHEEQADCEPEDKGPRPGEILEAQEEIERKLEILAILDERSKEVVMRRAQGQKLKAIGDELGITRERVRQIQERAMSQMDLVIKKKKSNLVSYQEMVFAQKQRADLNRERWRERVRAMQRLSLEHPEWTSIRLSQETGIGDRMCRKYMHRAK